MALVFNCPRCSRPIHAFDFARGKEMLCQTCSALVRVPALTKRDRNISLPEGNFLSHCPQCGAPVSLLRSAVGKEVYCPECKSTIIAPAITTYEYHSFGSLPAPLRERLKDRQLGNPDFDQFEIGMARNPWLVLFYKMTAYAVAIGMFSLLPIARGFGILLFIVACFLLVFVYPLSIAILGPPWRSFIASHWFKLTYKILITPHYVICCYKKKVQYIPVGQILGIDAREIKSYGEHGAEVENFSLDLTSLKGHMHFEVDWDPRYAFLHHREIVRKALMKGMYQEQDDLRWFLRRG